MVKMITVKQAMNKLLSNKAIIRLSSHTSLNQKYKKPLVIMDILLDRQVVQKQALFHNRRISDQALLCRDQYQCQYCGCRLTLQSMTRDHILPKKHGGKSNGDNLTCSCLSCNQKKRDRTLQQSGLKLLNQIKMPKYFYQTNEMKRLYWQYIYNKTILT